MNKKGRFSHETRYSAFWFSAHDSNLIMVDQDHPFSYSDEDANYISLFASTFASIIELFASTHAGGEQQILSVIQSVGEVSSSSGGKDHTEICQVLVATKNKDPGSK